MRRTLILLPLAALLWAGQAPPATRAGADKFTYGKETTLEGPLKSDGTVDYLRMFNEEFGAGIADEKNAAIPIYQASASAGDVQEALGAYKALHIDVPAAPLLVSLSTFAKDASPEDLNTWESITRRTLWKSADYPRAAEWLKQSEKGLALVEQACELPQCFMPVYEQEGLHGWPGIPPLAPFRMAAITLGSRALQRAGDDDFDGALQDIVRLRKLAQLVAQQPLELANLVGIAIDGLALDDCAELITKMPLKPEQLQQVEKVIDGYPSIKDSQRIVRAERLLSLSVAMTMILGDPQQAIRNYAGVRDEKQPVSLGDLEDCDWDIFLQAVNHFADVDAAEIAAPPKPLLARLAEIEEDETAAVIDHRPSSTLAPSSRRPTGITAIEEYLRRRGDEDRMAYSHRIANYFNEDDPAVRAAFAKLRALYTIHYQLALLTGELEDYHLAKGEYPEELAALGKPVPEDPFTGNPMQYRRAEKGYKAWSIGSDMQDQEGEAGDIAIRVER